MTKFIVAAQSFSNFESFFIFSLLYLDDTVPLGSLINATLSD